MTDSSSIIVNVGLFVLCAFVVQAITFYLVVRLFVTGRAGFFERRDKD